MKRFFEATQQLGRALMLPIAVLPVAGLLLRLGQPDLMNLAPIAAAGDAIFGNLGLLFAIGVAVGLAKENHGAAGLAGVVGFLVASKATEVIIQVPPEVAASAAALGGKSEALALAAHKARELSKLSVPLGIISGLIAGWLYNRYSDIRLPSYLAFFGGRRFVPIAAGFAGLLVAFVFGYGWPVLVGGMDALSKGVMASGEFGLFVYGVLNRILIVTGLHHILNNVAWFIVGDFNGVTGDLKRFFAGDPTAGMFMSGFFPVMMFGLPAACLAMYHTAMPDKKRAAGGLLLSMALTSFLTGVTEPIEFTFMFLAPMLYAIHALLQGAAHVTMHLLGVKLGFGFSAGFFDYALNFKLSTHPLYLIPVGLVYFGIYYGLFRYCIVKFDLKTPGREADSASQTVEAGVGGNAGVADGFITALGGAANLKTVDACTTRLRLVLADRNLVNEEALRRAGSRGMVKLGDHGLQVVLGPIADQVAGDIRARLAMPRTAADGASAAGAPTSVTPSRETPASTGPIPSVADLLTALGGRRNLLRFDAAAGRLMLKVADAGAVDEEALTALGVRGVARPAPGSVHVLHPNAPALQQLLAAS
jgi:PTS system N-acetylglucosamine-specific IIC component